jgi:hypothetical protein
MATMRTRPEKPAPAATRRHPTIVPMLELVRTALPTDVPDRTAESIIAKALAAGGRSEPPVHGSTLRAFIENELRDALRTALGERDGEEVLQRIRRSAMPPRTLIVASADPALPIAVREVLYAEDVLVVVHDATSLLAWARATRAEEPHVVLDLRDGGATFGAALLVAVLVAPRARFLVWCGDPAPVTPDLGPDAPALELCSQGDASAIATAIARGDDLPR